MNDLDAKFSEFLSSFQSTEEIEIPEKEIDKIIGQDDAVNTIKIAAKQKRHVLLIGAPGVGKSMIGKAYSEIMEHGDPKDILFYSNPENPFQPRVVKLDAGKGKQTIRQLRQIRNRRIDRIFKQYRAELFLVGLFLIMILTGQLNFQNGIFVLLLWIIFKVNIRSSVPPNWDIPVLAFSAEDDVDFFVDGTGLEAGGLFGDVLHDPYQSGGLETPPHKRLVLGAVHKADGGVLYIDEVGNLDFETQIELLTILQDRKAPIRGRSKESTASTIYTEPIPTDFSLLMAGNVETLELLHPALRSRIQGYGYEIFMKTEMVDNLENRKKLVRFVAQEVTSDGRIPHFSSDAVADIIKITQALSRTPGHLTLELRKVAGIVHTAGDIAISNKSAMVSSSHVKIAVLTSVPIEYSMKKRRLQFSAPQSAVIPPSVLYDEEFVIVKAEKINQDSLEIKMDESVPPSAKDFAENFLPNLLSEIGINSGKFIIAIEGNYQPEDIPLAVAISIMLTSFNKEKAVFCAGTLHSDGIVEASPLQRKRKLVFDLLSASKETMLFPKGNETTLKEFLHQVK